MPASILRSAAILLVLAGAASASALPQVAPSPARAEVLIDRDDVVITSSCLLRLPAYPIPDLDGDGVVQVVGDGIVVELDGTLRGAPLGAAPDSMNGFGIVVTGDGVTISGGAVAGFKVGVALLASNGSTVENLDLSDNFAERLRSTPEREDPADWLSPHANDDGEWARAYGAGLLVRDSREVVVRGCKARRTQNGILLERVVDSKVLGNDCSFLSGWGLAMWRSSRNLVARNAFDFCVRGYSHGVYNRGQDSAGILMFEQCEENVIALNSATHGGDGLFAFAGREALGEAPPPAGAGEDWHRGRGCNRNVIVGNDFSHAVAHGIEMTFSRENLIARNLLVDCGICGVWGGYSSGMEIRDNLFRRNGFAGYGGERGGVNIEHGQDNRIIRNRFEEDAVGVRLWWDEDPSLAGTPWAKANGTSCRGNLIAGNAFVGNGIAIELLAAEATTILDNLMGPSAAALDGAGAIESIDEASRSSLRREGEWPNERPGVGGLLDSIPGTRREKLEAAALFPAPAAPGATGSRERMIEVLLPGTPLDGRLGGLLAAVDEVRFDPTIARTAAPGRGGLAGRDRIVMTEWGPYAWDRPAIIPRSTTLETVKARLVGGGKITNVTVFGAGSLRTRLDPETGDFEVFCERPGMVCPFRAQVTHEQGKLFLEGLLAYAEWNIRLFRSSVDPLADPAGWRALAGGSDEEFLARGGAIAVLPIIDLPFGGGGPAEIAALAEVAGGLPADDFGLVATTTLRFPKGRFRLSVTSDDGVRLLRGGEVLVEQWGLRGASTDSVELDFAEPTDVPLAIEYFELRGAATLKLGIERIPPPSAGG